MGREHGDPARALERVGMFDVTLAHGGDEQEWQDRLRAREPGARVLYVAGAAVDHRRGGRDARLRALARTAHARGRAARRFDTRRGQAPSLARELTTLAGCAWHVLRHRCPAGLTMVAHSAGRVRECARTDKPVPAPAGAEEFLSGHSGTVGGVDAIVRGLRDATTDAWEIASARRLRLDLAARHEPPLRRVLAIGVVRPEHATRATDIRAELERSRHEVELHTCPPGELGKFENLNRLLSEHPASGHDWLLVVDDDIELPRGFLDRLLFLCERFDLQLAQPAHRLRSHAAWPVTRRRAAERRTRDTVRGDRSRDRTRARDVRHAAAVARAAHGLGAGRALGGARARAWLALWRRGRRGDRPSRGARRQRVLARGGG